MKYPRSWFSKWLLVRLPEGVDVESEQFEALRRALCDAVATVAHPAHGERVPVLTGVLWSDGRAPPKVRAAHVAVERMFGVENLRELHRRLGIEETEH